MPAENRPPSFQFYPREWIIDTRHLTRDQRARYHDALCESWLAESYGVATEKQWMDWLGYSESEWSDSGRIAFAERFKRNGRKWVQVRMWDTRQAQMRRHEQAKSGARIANAQRTHSARTAVAPASASDVRRKEKDSSLLPISDSDAGNGPAAPVPLAARIVRNSSSEPETDHPDARAQIEALQRTYGLGGLLRKPE